MTRQAKTTRLWAIRLFQSELVRLGLLRLYGDRDDYSCDIFIGISFTDFFLSRTGVIAAKRV